MDFWTSESLFKISVLVVSAFGAGALNAVAGGGSFLTFPALLLTGVTPISANATSSVSLWPGSIASSLAYRRELSGTGRTVLWLGVASLLGGTLGGWLLLRTPERAFADAIPWLMLAATLAFTFGNSLVRRFRPDPATELTPGHTLLGPAIAQFVISIYGGYFGGGMGIVMLALFSFLRLGSIHRLNALKSICAVLLNGAAIVLFAVSRAVVWQAAALMAAGAIAGGYAGAAGARRVNPQQIRVAVIAIAWGLTAYFFLKR